MNWSSHVRFVGIVARTDHAIGSTQLQGGSRLISDTQIYTHMHHHDYGNFTTARTSIAIATRIISVRFIVLFVLLAAKHARTSNCERILRSRFIDNR
jgi:hypothetical protein